MIQHDFRTDPAYDAVVLGSGPAGLAAADALQRDGLNAVVLEKGSLAHHIAEYPTFMTFHSTRENVELGGYPLTIPGERPTRREYLTYLARFVQDRGLDVRTYTEVVGLTPPGPEDEECFRVHARRPSGQEIVFRGRSVVVAVGAYENPRRLHCPGEGLSKVHYHLKEVHSYVGTKVLVVGGRNSAAENALALWRAGVEVSISYRRPEFNAPGLKYWLKPDLENRVRKGEITSYMNTTVARIDWDTVTLRQNDDGTEIVLPNDFVLAQTGYNPPEDFLRSLGLELDPETLVPAHDPETLESNIPGVYVAGTIIAGSLSGHVFIENSRYHGDVIREAIRARRATVAR